MEEPIDFVITWVDGNDPEWQREKVYWEAQVKASSQEELFDTWFNNPIRYRDWDNLRYWFRGVEEFAPWVNKIHFVTWGHVPSWLDVSNPKLHIVNHKDFIPHEYLPTFNSHTIEWNMHRISGLAERFVYFNDDMFLIKSVCKDDFFKKGLPCETAALDCVALDCNIGHAEIKNTQILNKYFVKREVIKKDWKKWIVPMYGKQLIKTLVLMPWDQFNGIFESHLPISYLKRTFDVVWKKEHDVIDATCRTKFRDNENVSHWLVKNWQLLTGCFYPRNPKFGKMYLQNIDAEVCNTIIQQECKMVCINDIECDEIDFDKQKKALNSAFDLILPKKSSFEL